MWLLLVPLFVAVVKGQEGEDEPDPFQQFQEELNEQFEDEQAEDVFDSKAVGPHNTHLTYIFPESPFLNIESGKFCEILVGITNTAEADLILRTVEGSFRYNMNMSEVLQNFTAYKYDVTMGSNEQATISYKFPVGAVFQPIEIGLVIALTFETPDKYFFRLPAFNGTVTLVDPVRTFDFQVIFLYLFGVGLLAVCGYAIYNAFLSKRFRGSKRSSSTATSTKTSKTETGTNSKEVDLEWIPAQNLKQSPNVKARKR